MGSVKIFCRMCEKARMPRDCCWVPQPIYDMHMKDAHHQVIEQKILDAIAGMRPKIIHILEHSPQARSDPATLVSKYAQYNPYQIDGKSYRIIYDDATKVWELPHFSDFHHMLKFMRYLANIEREDRAVRSIIRPDLNESPRKAIHTVQETITRSMRYAEAH